MSNVKIIGMGLVSGMGRCVDDAFQKMCAEGDAFREITRFDPQPYAKTTAGQLDEALENSLREDFPDDDLAVAMMKTAGTEAFAQAAGQPCPPERLALVLATNFGPMETLEWAWRERLDTGAMLGESYRPFASVLSDVASYFNCRGPQLQLTMSCASGGAAASVARDLIRARRADAVLVLAYDVLTEYAWCGLSNLHTITTDTMRPFDRDRSGTIFSEGAAAMLLAGDQTPNAPLAWLAGAATGNNAFHLTAPRKEAEGSRLVMAEAVRQAGLTPDDIQHVCAHATSTRANDETEAAALRNLFSPAHLPNVTVAAHKSQLGHLLGAAGLAEAVITVRAMQTGVLPPIIRSQNIDAACQHLNLCPKMAKTASFDHALTNSAGIGGNNAALVISRHQPMSAPAATPCHTLYIRAMSWVLPAHVGCGGDLLQHPEWLRQTAGLDDFNAKPYLSSIKGYLDPGDAFQLAAFSILAKQASLSSDPQIQTRRGLVTCTHYGTCTSAFGFYEQLVQKGPRYASPMVFPHGYASAPGNLAAIEFGCAGPHLVLSGPQNLAAALLFAADHFQDHSADDLLIGAYEAPLARALPDDQPPLLKGAIAFLVAPTPSADDLLSLSVERLQQASAQPYSSAGAIPALMSLLTEQAPGA